MNVGIPFGITHFYGNISTTSGAVVLVTGIASVIFKYRPIMTIKYCFPAFHLGRGPIISIAMNSIGSLVGNMYKLVWY